MKKIMLLAVVVAMATIFLVSGVVSARDFGRGGGHRGGGHYGYHGGGGHHGGGHFWGGLVAGAIAGAIIAPHFYYRPHAPHCYNQIVSPGYYTYDYRGYRIWIPPVMVRECY